MKTATVSNIGPVQEATIPIPEEGGIVVFRGRNGSGKSTLLNTIDAAVGNGKIRVPVRDGQLKGEFSGFGVKLTIGRSSRRSGEAEVHTLEGRLSVADLVDPGIADPEKADSHRIKALVGLVGSKPDLSLFRPLAASDAEFDQIVSPSASTHDDLVAMAGAVKRDFEAASRKRADSCANIQGRAVACRRNAEGVTLDVEHDPQALQAKLEAAVRHQSELEQRAKAAAECSARVGAAKRRLEALERSLFSVEERQAEFDEVSRRFEASLLRMEEARREFALAQQEADKVSREHSTANERLLQAKETESAIAICREQIKADSVLPVAPIELTRARVEVEIAREAIEMGAIVRRALETIAKADQLDGAAAAEQAEAERLRAAARGVDEVLSAVVAKSGVPLRIEPVEQRMRLVLDTARGRTCFGELSDGERWRVALDIAIKAVGRGGEITIPQSAWEGLDPSARAIIAGRLRDAGVIAYTAEAADGELRAEVYGGAA